MMDELDGWYLLADGCISERRLVVGLTYPGSQSGHPSILTSFKPVERQRSGLCTIPGDPFSLNSQLST
jgi:hypothetical protein